MTIGAGLMVATLAGAACSGRVITTGAGGGPSAEVSAGAPGQGPSKASAGAASNLAGAGNAGPGSSGTGGAGANASGAGGALSSAGGAIASGTAGAPYTLAGIPLTPTDGWIAVDSNAWGIQGAIFPFADSYSRENMMSDFKESHACIAGTAARVDLTCTPVPPATDCYGMIFGAGIGLNLNQPIDPITMMGVDTPLPYDASKIRGFAFTLSGTTVPRPKELRFQVETADQAFCNLQTVKLEPGPNIMFFKDLVTECFVHARSPDLRPTAESAKSLLTRISWQVLTNIDAEVPYDFCVSDLRVIPQ